MTNLVYSRGVLTKRTDPVCVCDDRKNKIGKVCAVREWREWERVLDGVILVLCEQADAGIEFVGESIVVQVHEFHPVLYQGHPTGERAQLCPSSTLGACPSTLQRSMPKGLNSFVGACTLPLIFCVLLQRRKWYTCACGV